MIIYGVKNRELSKQLITDKCQNCGASNTIVMHVFQEYAHIFWVPIAPIGKTGVSQCNHCNQVIQLNKMPGLLKNAYENAKNGLSTPAWTFSGLGLITICMVIAFGFSKKKDETNAKLILAPVAGDVFEIKEKADQYTIFKVDAVRGDSVILQPSKYETSKSSGLYELKQKEYADDYVSYTRSELKQMLASGEIIDIDRK